MPHHSPNISQQCCQQWLDVKLFISSSNLVVALSVWVAWVAMARSDLCNIMHWIIFSLVAAFRRQDMRPVVTACLTGMVLPCTGLAMMQGEHGTAPQTGRHLIHPLACPAHTQHH